MIDLADLDDAHTIELDADVFQKNIDALRADAPELACRIVTLELPRHWRPVRALDQSPTWRLEPPGLPPQWLDTTAAPRTRARACLAQQRGASVSLALPSIGTGAEVAELLRLISPHATIFAFEHDLRATAAILRVVSLDDALRAGRLILHLPDDEAGSLRAVLQRYSGLRPPARVLALPNADDQRVAAVHALCESVAPQIVRDRNERLTQCREKLAATATPTETLPRIAILSLSENFGAHALAAEIEVAARTLGWPSACCVARGPRDVDPLPHALAVSELRPSMTVAVNCRPGALPLTIPRPLCQWHVRRITDDAVRFDADVTHLAASPSIAADLRRAGVAESAIVECFFAAVRTAEPNWSAVGEEIVLFGDRPAADAVSCGIVQPTHKTLWTALHAAANETWGSEAILDPPTLLQRAERTSGVKLGERALRDRMARIVEHVLIPATIIERILRVLREAGRDPLVVGRGWNAGAELGVQAIAATVTELEEQRWEQRPLAAIFAGPIDPLGPALLQCAARGWPLLIHSPDTPRTRRRFGGVLHAKQHFAPFAGARELRAAIGALEQTPEESLARCRRAVAHVRRQHTLVHRLQDLARACGLSAAATSDRSE